jgi:ribosomal protein S18 acetylase RimI-like enzyme
MMDAHYSGMKMLRKQYKESKLWYLEVIAIHPLLQSCGLGKKVMQRVLEHAKGRCIVLECTSERSLTFYEGLGFSIAREVELTSPSKSSPGEVDTVKNWLMIKDDRNRGSTI